MFTEHVAFNRALPLAFIGLPNGTGMKKIMHGFFSF